MATTYLAKAKITALSQDALQTLSDAQHGESEVFNLEQSHYYLEGSLELQREAVLNEFREWCNARADMSGANYDFSYWNTNVLGVMPDKVIFYVYKRGVIAYFSLPFTVEGNGVVMGDDPEPVGVKMVLDEMGFDPDDDGDVDETAQSAAAITHKSAPKGYPKSKTEYAMPSDYKYPLDTKAHVKAAWSYIHKAENRTGYSKSELASAEARIKKAGKKFGVEMNQSEKDPITHEVTSDAASATAATTAAPKPLASVTEETEAVTSGKTVDPLNATKPVKRAIGNEGDAEGEEEDVSDDDEVAGALADVEAGLKQSLIQSDDYDEKNQHISLIQSIEAGDAKDPHMKISGIATRANIINSQGQVYPIPVWKKNLIKMNQEAASGKFLGKLEHPAREEGLVDAAIIYDKFWMEGADVHFQGKVLKTAIGKDLEAMLQAGVQVDLSTRGSGSLKQGKWQGKDVHIVQSNFICTGIDAVWYGASSGSGITEAVYQSKTMNKTGDENTMSADNTTPSPTVEDKAAALELKQSVIKTRANLFAEHSASLSETGKQALQSALNAKDTLEGLFQVEAEILPIFQASMGAPAAEAEALTQATTYTPTFYVEQDKEATAPKDINELFDRMVQDLPNEFPGQRFDPAMTKFSSPREACRAMLQHTMEASSPMHDYKRAAQTLLALEQGKLSLAQSFSAEAVIANGNADPGGAPLSAPMIFPLVRRVFPQYIVNEIAAVQPMDRPTGKIFYMDVLRAADPSHGTDPRIDLNTSANPFNSSFLDNATEGSAVKRVKMKLTSTTVTAVEKKVAAQWSIEDMQDLRAYHGLDAATELMGGAAKELALEYNELVLNDMLAQATGGNRTYGMTMPVTGFSQQEWDAYIWNYIQALDNDIYAKRNGNITHLVCGIDAALALGKSLKIVSNVGMAGADNAEMYPGSVYFGHAQLPAGGQIKILKTNFWGQGTANGSKILAIRKGAEWSDTAYIFSPYADYVAPLFTDPEDMSQKQGIVSRAAHQVVVSDAMAYLTVANSQGVVITS